MTDPSLRPSFILGTPPTIVSYPGIRIRKVSNVTDLDRPPNNKHKLIKNHQCKDRAKPSKNAVQNIDFDHSTGNTCDLTSVYLTSYLPFFLNTV